MSGRSLLAGMAMVLVLLVGAAPASASDGVAGPDPALAEWPEWPYKASCNGMTFDPVAAFSGPTNAERGRLPAERALRRLLGRDFPFPLPQHHWRLAATKPGRALFLHGRLGAEMETPTQLESYELRRRKGHWEMNAYSSICHPLSARGGHFATTWFLSKSQPELTATTERIRIDVGARCSKSEDLNARAEPEFTEIAGKLVLTVFIRPARKTTNVACFGEVPPGPPLVVELPGPLGTRQLFDGGLFPPSPASHLPEETHVVFGRTAG